MEKIDKVFRLLGEIKLPDEKWEICVIFWPNNDWIFEVRAHALLIGSISLKDNSLKFSYYQDSVSYALEALPHLLPSEDCIKSAVKGIEEQLNKFGNF